MRDDIEKFIEYNLVDVELVVEFDKKLQFIDLCRGICHFSVMYLMKILCIHRNTWRKPLLTYLRRRNLVAPNKAVIEKKK